MAHTVFNAVDAHVALELEQNAHQNKIQIVNRVGLITTTPTLLDMRDVSSVTSIRIASLAIRKKSKNAQFSLELCVTVARMVTIVSL